MLTLINNRVIGRKGNVLLVDFSRPPNPPAPRFPGANGLREPRCEETSFEPLAGPSGSLPRLRRFRRLSAGLSA
jgi:hypothetical protein